HLTREDCDGGPTDQIVRISPHVLVHSTDPSYLRLQASWDKWSAKLDSTDEFTVWFAICHEEKSVCSAAFAALFDTNDSLLFPSKFRKTTTTPDDNRRTSVLVGTGSGGKPYLRSLLDPNSMVEVT